MTRPAALGITSVSLWATRIAIGRVSYTGASVSCTARFASTGPSPSTATFAIVAPAGRVAGVAPEAAGARTAISAATVAATRSIDTDGRRTWR
jgi:hypothetical protein